jgi:hypothetical protein
VSLRNAKLLGLCRNFSQDLNFMISEFMCICFAGLLSHGFVCLHLLQLRGAEYIIHAKERDSW